MLEHGSWMSVLIAGVTRDSDKDIPVITRWVGKFILPMIPAALIFGATFYVSVQLAFGHIADNRQAIMAAEAHIQQVADRQDKIMDDVSKRIDSIQTMLAIELSKRR